MYILNHEHETAAGKKPGSEKPGDKQKQTEQDAQQETQQRTRQPKDNASDQPGGEHKISEHKIHGWVEALPTQEDQKTN